MTPREADRIIRLGVKVQVKDKYSSETFWAVFVRRDRRHIETADGGLFERIDLEIVK